MQEPSLWAAILERLRRLDAAWARREAWRAGVVHAPATADGPAGVSPVAPSADTAKGEEQA
jgi:hypothetical protein